jgi:hypothetical protein
MQKTAFSLKFGLNGSLFRFIFPTTNLYAFLVSFILATCLANHMIVYFIVLMLCCKE